MKRDDCRDAALHRLRGTTHGRGRNDAHVTMSHVGTFVGNRVADGANAGSGQEKSKARCARRSDPPNANSIHALFAGRWCDRDDVVSRAHKRGREVLKMTLDAADAWMKPVADERDLQLAIDTE